jgi:hypothetical protein
MKYKLFISKNFFLDLFISFLFKYLPIFIYINYYNINLFLKNIFFFFKITNVSQILDYIA